jgi:hypothetical protein
LVSNGRGGYTERRIAVNTDTIGTEFEYSGQRSFMPYRAPAAAAQVGDYWRARISGGEDVSGTYSVTVPDAQVFLVDQSTGLRYPPVGEVLTDLKGEYVVPGVQPTTMESATCAVEGSSEDCTQSRVMLSEATSQYHRPSVGTSALVGKFTLEGGTACGTTNEFFGVHVWATATLLDASGHVLAGPVRVNEAGDYSVPTLPGATSVVLSCENAAAVSIPFGGADLGTTLIAGVSPPVVVTMTATLHGQALDPPVAIFLPPVTGEASDIDPRADLFLTEKGLDSRLGACKYYKAIGAVRGCTPNGDLIGPISYLEWQRAVKIGSFADRGGRTFMASYINKVDLNLARVHQSITYGPNRTAAVVCNHLGASDFFNPTQSDIDTAVLNAVNHKDLVACVAMDYMVSPGVNNDQPFVRFLIFGPNGQLLPSINLDGRREKFVPGTCVVCHGGDHYAGKFPEDDTGFANVGGHFLPYDVGNFEFASKPGLRKCDQENAIFHLNQNLLNAGPREAETELIAGWYSTSGSVQCPSGASHVLNEDYVPPSWANQDTISVEFYKNVLARSCRTCHVAMSEGYNFDHYDNVTHINGTDALPGGSYDFEVTACGGVGSGSYNSLRWYTMPNSLVTFNRFWRTYQNGVGLPDQVTLLQEFAADTGNGGSCTPIVW